MKRIVTVCMLLAALFVGVSCTKRGDTNSYKDSVTRALEQADLKGVTVSEDRDKNTITLGGKLHSDDAKSRAGEVAKSAAQPRVIANEISVQPVGQESEARTVTSNLDDGIEKNYKAALIASHLDKQHIRFAASNGVLTLNGTVKSAGQKQEAEKLAAKVPNVKQVVNQLDVKG
jgi:osmotically-inducible protein OsmY